MALNAHTTNCALWNTRLAEYQKRSALLKANREFGYWKRADEAFNDEKRRLEDRYGAFRSSEAPAAWEGAWAKMGQAEDAHHNNFIMPADQAAIALFNTPSPDLAAAIFKVQVIIDHELDNHCDIPGEPMDLVLAEMAQF